MAENKKSFILYADLIHTVRKMPKNKQADLFMAILGYVNDENPEVKDLVVQIAFEPVKQQLKRDLKRWEKYKEKQSEFGKLGGRPKKDAKNEGDKKGSLNPERVESLNVTDNVTVTDNDILLINNDGKNLTGDLTEMEAGQSIEFISLTLSRKYTTDRIRELWKAFSIQNPKKFYADRLDKVNHFRNWIKTQPYEKIKSGNGSNGDTGPKAGTSEARTERARNW